MNIPKNTPRTQQPFRREERYYVLKISDMRKYLSAEKQEAVREMARKINAGRTVDGKAFLQAAVVEHDWPEYERVWQMIETRMTTTQAQPFNPNDDRRFWPIPFSQVKLEKFDVVCDAPATPEQAMAVLESWAGNLAITFSRERCGLVLEALKKIEQGEPMAFLKKREADCYLCSALVKDALSLLAAHYTKEKA